MQMAHLLELLHGGERGFKIAAVHRLHEAAVRGVDFAIRGVGLSFESPLGFAPSAATILLKEFDVVTDTERVARNVRARLSGAARLALGESRLHDFATSGL